jgi:hypothetical protein
MNRSANHPLEAAAEPFITERLQLAVFLHATKLLTLERCELSASGKVRFVFLEAKEAGEQTELDFDTGASVSATALFASQKFLRRKINELINHKRSINEAEHHNIDHC